MNVAFLRALELNLLWSANRGQSFMRFFFRQRSGTFFTNGLHTCFSIPFQSEKAEQVPATWRGQPCNVCINVPFGTQDVIGIEFTFYVNVSRRLALIFVVETTRLPPLR